MAKSEVCGEDGKLLIGGGKCVRFAGVERSRDGDRPMTLSVFRSGCQ